MAEGKIIRLGGGRPVVINGQVIIQGEYQENISELQTVYAEETEDIAQSIKLNNPNILPTGSGNDVAFSADSKYLAVAHNTSPFITIYKRTGQFFEKIPNPTVIPTAACTSVTFSDDNLYLAIGYFSSPYIIIYKIENDQFIKVVDPSPIPPNTVASLSFGLNSTYLATAHSGLGGTTQPRFSVYKRSGDNFNRLANLSSSTIDQFGTDSVHFATDASYLAAIGSGNTNLNFFVYKRSGDSFTRLTTPDVGGFAVRFSHNTDYLVAGASSATRIYKRCGDNFNLLSNAVQPSNPNGI
jgi:WD40 repeat protein